MVIDILGEVGFVYILLSLPLPYSIVVCMWLGFD